MKYTYIIFYSFEDKRTGHPRFARAEKEFSDAITSGDLLAFEEEQKIAGDFRAVVTGFTLVGVVQGED